MALINPEITLVGTDVVEDWEGCLSIPDIRGRVPRAREIQRARLRSARATASSCSAHDFPARVIQHETDHLDGVLFFDRMKSFETLTFLDEYRATGRRTRTIAARSPTAARASVSSARSDCRRSSSTSE